MDDSPITSQDPQGMDRRAVLRRGAVLGGALVWTVPAVQTLAGPAFAAGSPCVGKIRYTDTNGACLQVGFLASNTCCDCIVTNTPTTPFGVLGAAIFCQLQGQCAVDPAVSTTC